MWYYDFVRRASADPTQYYYVNPMVLPNGRGHVSEYPQPTYYPMYGSTDVSIYDPGKLMDPRTEDHPFEAQSTMSAYYRVNEYVRYRKIRNLKGAGSPDPDDITTWSRPDQHPVSMERMPDPVHQPKVYHDKNIHLAINAILGKTNGDVLLTKESYEGLPDDQRFELLLEASLALVMQCHRIAAGCTELLVIRTKNGSQAGLRKFQAILWRSMATHLRFHYRNSPGCITWEAFKFIADHHPMADIRKYFKYTEVNTYEPEILAAQVTLLEIPDPKRRAAGLHNVAPMNFPELSKYIKWFAKSYPITVGGTPNAWEVGLANLVTKEHVRGTIQRQFKLPTDLKKNLTLAIHSGKLNHTGKTPAELLANLEAALDFSTWDASYVYGLAQAVGVPIYTERSWRSFRDLESYPTKSYVKEAPVQETVFVGGLSWDSDFSFAAVSQSRALELDVRCAFPSEAAIRAYLKIYEGRYDSEKMESMLTSPGFLEFAMLHKDKTRTEQEIFLSVAGLSIVHANPWRRDLYTTNPQIPSHIIDEVMAQLEFPNDEEPQEKVVELPDPQSFVKETSCVYETIEEKNKKSRERATKEVGVIPL